MRSLATLRDLLVHDDPPGRLPLPAVVLAVLATIVQGAPLDTFRTVQTVHIHRARHPVAGGGQNVLREAPADELRDVHDHIVRLGPLLPGPATLRLPPLTPERVDHRRLVLGKNLTVAVRVDIDLRRIDPEPLVRHRAVLVHQDHVVRLHERVKGVALCAPPLLDPVPPQIAQSVVPRRFVTLPHVPSPFRPHRAGTGRYGRSRTLPNSHAPV